jgi:signal transduction protein with GAF and PtsI domain
VTNEEVIAHQRAAKAHREALPGAVAEAKAAIQEDDKQVVCLFTASVRTLLHEVERLQAALKRANDDLRDEQREAQHAASSAYTEGRHDGIEETRVW